MANLWNEIIVALILGPGAYLFLKSHFTGHKPSRDALILTLVWTYFMLLMHYVNLMQLETDHTKACQQLEAFVRKQNRGATEFIYSEMMPSECNRYTPEYAEGELEAKAAQRQ